MAVTAAVLVATLAGCTASAVPAAGARSVRSASSALAAPTTVARTTTVAPTTAVAPTSAAPTPQRPDVHGVVAFGDSVPAGSACHCTTYPALVAAALGQTEHHTVAAVNLASAGLRTQGLLDQLGDRSTDAALAHGDLTIVTIGANDFDSSIVTDSDCGPDRSLACYDNQLMALRSTLGTVLDRIRSLMPAHGRVLVTGYWNVFLDGKVGRSHGRAYVVNSDALTRAVNAVIDTVAEEHGAQYVDVYTPFKGGHGERDDTALLAPDGDHPNAPGHAAIARALLAALAA